MFKTLSKYSARRSAKIARIGTDFAKATPGYLGEVSATFKEEWKKGYEQQKEKAKN